MKRISLRLFLALLTFVIGIAFTAFWLFEREIPDISVFNLETQISKEYKKFWNKEVLVRFKEKPLEEVSDSNEESYRLVLIPTFDAPVSIRLWRSGDKRFLISKKTNGQGGFGIKKFGELSYEKTQTLSEEEWFTFIKLLDQAYFWEMPSIDRNEEIVGDGATWVIEASNSKTFHEVHRRLPSKEFKDNCTYLLTLASLENDYKGY